MHAFVVAILLRVSRFDALDGDAEPQPPDGEFGEVEQAIGSGKGDAITELSLHGIATSHLPK